MIRVLIADDEPMIRAGVRAVLASDPDMEIVAEAGDGHEAVELVRRHRPAVAVLDIRMPGRGVAAAWEISARMPETKVVMLTVSTDRRDLLDAVRPTPAYVLDQVSTVLAVNPEGERLMPGVRERGNLVRYVFTDPRAREVFVVWEDMARDCVAHLRTVAAADPARSGGAAPTTRSVPSAIIGPMPR